MIPDRYTVYARVPRKLYEDKPALQQYLGACWIEGVRHEGGEPIDGGPTLKDGPKLKNGQDILFGNDEEGWDEIWVRATGASSRPEDPMTPMSGDAATWVPDDDD